MKNYVWMWAEEGYSAYELNIILSNYGPRCEKLFGCGIKEGVVVYINQIAEFLMPKEDVDRIQEICYKFFTNKSKFEKFLSSSKNSRIALINFVKKLLKINFEKLSNQELWELWDLFNMHLGTIFVHYSMSQPFRVIKLEEEVINFLESKNYDIAKYLPLITISNVKFEFDKENVFFKKSFSKLIAQSSKKFDLSILDKPLYSEKVNPQKRFKVLRELGSPKKIVEVTGALAKLGDERLRERLAWMPAIYYSFLFINEFNRRLGVVHDLRYYEDLKKLVVEGKKLTKKNLFENKKGIVKILSNGKINSLKGQKAVDFSERINKLKKNAKLKGMVASKGKAVGRVTVLSYRKPKEHKKKISMIKKGDIIVTEMTRPNIIPACEKAGGIITDEGGILSHAAIVSRELGIPCIIGTQNATKVLSDGDLIELDAETGSIKKITEHQYLNHKLQTSAKKAKKSLEHKISKSEIRKGNCFWLKDLDKSDLATVGGKGASLGELSKIANVPNAFCISVSVFDKVLSHNNLKEKIRSYLKNINTTDLKSIANVGKKIRKLIQSAEIPKEIEMEISTCYNTLSNKCVAVRSSATAEDLPDTSFAGQQDTYLNVYGFEKVVDSVKKCWASLYTDRAIYYREKNNFDHTSVLISVVIQEMVNPKYSGVTFTLNPVRGKDMIIEIVKGVGEKLVSGEVTPNSYSITSSTYNVLANRSKFRFSTDKVRAIAKECKKLEKHYKIPLDIEWSIGNDNKLYFLQARPITTL